MSCNEVGSRSIILFYFYFNRLASGERSQVTSGFD